MEYSSVQYIKVKNTTLALVYYVTCTVVLAYIVWTIFDTKAYQLFDPLVANTFLKMKGSAHTTDGTVWDQYDFVVPPILPDSVFVGTNFIMTPGQTQGECAGIDKNLEICDCPLGDLSLCCPEGEHSENGMYTGKCSNDTVHCEMRGWCPFETKPADPDKNLLIGVDEWTLFARINGKFHHWDRHVSNTALQPEMIANNGVDLWSMEGIADKAGVTMDELRHKGGIIVANIRFDCNIDKHEKCIPDVSFVRLDDPTDPVSSGFNFRYFHGTRDLETGVASRDLWKLYGVFIVFQVYGQGGGYDTVTFLTSLGALLAYFGFSTLVCDIVLQYFLPGRKVYEEEKFRDVTSTVGNLQQGNPRASDLSYASKVSKQ